MRFWKSKRFPIQLALGLLVGLMVSLVAGCPQRSTNLGEKGIKKFSKEPSISLFMNKTGQKTVLPMETYIERVVAGEMMPNWPPAAYEAQAIVARTFTLELLTRTGGVKKLHGTDMSTDEKETQAYNEEAVTPLIKAAVRKTRGMVATYNNRYIRAWFHSAAGPRTARAKEGLNIPEAEPPYTVSVRSNESLAPAEFKNWSAEIPLAEVKAALVQGIKDIGDITKIDITGKGPSGRVTEFTITHSNGTTRMSGPDFRTLVGPEKMRSALLDSISTEGGVLKMTGKGFGHGVGMSQWGAYTMAKSGRSGKAIVRHYFKGVSIQKLWR